jgi:inward rectifier potassium channel
MDGVPTLFLRIGNDRDGAIIDAQISCEFIHTHHTKEGQLLYRMRDLTLVRSRTPALARTWTVMHVIDPSSPLWEATPESLAAIEMELGVSVVGTDGTSLQPVHGRRRYLAEDLLWGYRFVDALQERDDGKLVLDVRRFDEVTEATANGTFPYPRGDRPTR